MSLVSSAVNRAEGVLDHLKSIAAGDDLKVWAVKIVLHCLDPDGKAPEGTEEWLLQALHLKEQHEQDNVDPDPEPAPANPAFQPGNQS